MKQSPETILLIEREPVTASDIKKFLTEEGYSVIHVLPGEEAVRIAGFPGNRIDLILADIEIYNGTTGTETVKTILKDHDIPVVFLCTDTDTGFRDSTEEITSYGYILKNSGRKILSASVKTALNLFCIHHDLKEKNTRTQAGIGLSESDSMYRQLIENAGEAIFIAQDNVLKYVNPKTTGLTGYTKEELCSHPFIEFIHPDDRKMVMEKYQHRIKGDFIPHIYQFRIIHKTGEIRWIELNAILFRWAGRPATLNFVTDVTGSKQTEKIILELNHKYEEAMQAAKMVYWEFDIPSGSFYLNDRFFQMYVIPLKNETDYRINLEVFSGRFVMPEFRTRFKDAINQAIKSVGTVYQDQLEVQMLRGNSEEFWVSMWLYTEKDPGGLTVRLHGVNQDITERKAVEESLKSSRDILSLAVELSRIGPWEYDFRKEHFIFSDEFYNIYGTSAAIEGVFMTGEKYAAELVHPDDAFVVKKELDRALTASAREFSVHLEHRIIRRDGAVRTIAVLAKILKNSAGELIKWYGANQDITDQKQIEEKLRLLVSEKENLLKELQHRVKNNMNIISSLLCLGMKNITDEKSTSIFTDAISRISSMSNIYEQLYSSNVLDKVDLGMYIKTLADSIFKTYNINPDKKILTADIANVNLDVKRTVPLGLILNELITNSLKYAYPADSPGEIRVNLQQSGNILTLAVSDDGIGMPENFDIEKSESMGFMLVSILTKQIDGTLHIESKKGTSVYVKFTS